ncbi:hypothetical protein BSLG_008642 [Batrachochytrium salamandrivorans]|nr:hypothetical protein BSLG_008642 [Batrachochytrium salamandrivorans]
MPFASPYISYKKPLYTTAPSRVMPFEIKPNPSSLSPAIPLQNTSTTYRQTVLPLGSSLSSQIGASTPQTTTSPARVVASKKPAFLSTAAQNTQKRGQSDSNSSPPLAEMGPPQSAPMLSPLQPPSSIQPARSGGSISERLAALSVSAGIPLQPLATTVRYPSTTEATLPVVPASQVSATQLLDGNLTISPEIASDTLIFQPPSQFHSTTLPNQAQSVSPVPRGYLSDSGVGGNNTNRSATTALPGKSIPPPLPARSSLSYSVALPNTSDLRHSLAKSTALSNPSKLGLDRQLPRPIPDVLFNRYANAFLDTGVGESGVLDPKSVGDIWLRSRLSWFQLASIWLLVDVEPSVYGLTLNQFVIGLFLVDDQLKGNPLPAQLPPNVLAFIRPSLGNDGGSSFPSSATVGVSRLVKGI